jgi:hypothetical protein
MKEFNTIIFQVCQPLYLKMPWPGRGQSALKNGHFAINDGQSKDGRPPMTIPENAITHPKRSQGTATELPGYSRA